jgi:hypothetical protein
MTKRHTITALLVFLVVAVGLGGTIGYGAYYRSDLYRRRVEESLTKFFNLPTDVGKTRPYTFSSREMFAVEVWLPGRRERIFRCEHAVWDNGGSGDHAGTLVVIDDPIMSIGSEAWETEDYMKVLRASLVQSYRERNIHEIRLNRATIIWPRRDFRMSARDVDGAILFDDAGQGEGRLTCRKLNGMPVSEPVQILAHLDPHAEDFITEVTLTMPTFPMQGLGLDQALGGEITSGSFAGRITLKQGSDGDRIRFSGAANEVKLEELTARVPSGPIPAVIDLGIDEILLREGELERLAFRGEVRKLKVGALLAVFGLGDLDGEARLTVRDARLSGEKLERLALSGEWLDAAAGPFLQHVLGKAGVHGQLSVRVNNFEVRDNELTQADAEVRVLPPHDGPATIDRALLLDLLKDKAGLSISEKLLPKEIEFTQMSARLLLDGRRLRVLSVGGPSGPPAITIKLLGKELPLLAKLDLSVDLGPLQDNLKMRLKEWRGAVEERIRRKAATRPGS